MGTRELELNLTTDKKHDQQNVSRRTCPPASLPIWRSQNTRRDFRPWGVPRHCAETSVYFLSNFLYPSKALTFGSPQESHMQKPVHLSWKDPCCLSNPNLSFHNMLTRFQGGGDLPKPSKVKVRARTWCSNSSVYCTSPGGWAGDSDPIQWWWNWSPERQWDLLPDLHGYGVVSTSIQLSPLQGPSADTTLVVPSLLYPFFSYLHSHLPSHSYFLLLPLFFLLDIALWESHTQRPYLPPALDLHGL